MSCLSSQVSFYAVFGKWSALIERRHTWVKLGNFIVFDCAIIENYAINVNK